MLSPGALCQSRIDRKGAIVTENRCVCCGEIIPEGYQVCMRCERDVESEDDLISRQQAIEAVKRIIHARLSEEAIYAEIEQIPKAYDKEKVIEELKYCRDFYDINEQPENRFDFRECADVREHKGKWIAYDEAIKVVEKGGIE